MALRHALLLLLLAAVVQAGAVSPEAAALGRRLLKHKKAAAADVAATDGAAGPVTEAAAAVAGDCCARLPAGFHSNLPVVIVDLQGQPFNSIPKPQIETGVKAKIPAAVCTCGSPDGHEVSGPVGFSERGSHSEDYNKVRSYSVNLDNASRFLGMPKAKSWALYGPQNDTAGMHDWLGFWLYRQTGNYAARTQYIELFITPGSSTAAVPLQYPGDYLGLYLAMEHINQGKDRVDIQKNNGSDVTGGYILDNEHGKAKQGLVELPPLEHSQIPYLVEYPTKPTQAMQDYILGYLRDFESALFGPAFADPQAGWRHLSNQSSAVDYFLFEELVKSNNNGYRGSQRLYKDAQQPLNFGPPWDFNDGFGQCCGFPVEGYHNGGQSNGSSGGSAISPEGWMFNICEQPERCKYDPISGIAIWYRRMWQDPTFQAAAGQRFQQLRGSVWTDAAISQAIRATQAAIHDAVIRTFAKWPVDFLNPYAPQQSDAEAQLQATVDKLTQWTSTRLAWMAAQLGAPPAAPSTLSTAPAPPTAAISSISGEAPVPAPAAETSTPAATSASPTASSAAALPAAGTSAHSAGPSASVAAPPSGAATVQLLSPAGSTAPPTGTAG